MLILLFIYVILLLFIIIIIHNSIYYRKQNNQLQNTNQYIPQTTCANCIPHPPIIKGERKFY